ncbi:hypothetical protein GCM10009767_19070 [Kocuria aegyptia]|uniref:Uncharacterized protein n=1 Tax=Kocuria aegyptia TaxID=330943 RepID=A0ABN2KMB0_9MICC
MYSVLFRASAGMEAMARFTAGSMRKVTETLAPPAKAAETGAYP